MHQLIFQLIFQERYIQNAGITELSYISGKVYSERWHDGTFLIFQERYIQSPGIMELFLYFRKVILKTLA